MKNTNQIKYVDNIPITIIRSKRRRSFGIQVKEDKFVLRVPSRASQNNIQHSLNRFAPWVRQRQAILETAEKPPTYEFQFGEQFPWLNTQLTLTSVDKHHKTELVTKYLPVHLPNSVRNQSAYIQKRVIDFYKGVGLRHLVSRVNYFAELVGKQPTDVKTYSYKRRWGSCSSQGDPGLWESHWSKDPAYFYPPLSLVPVQHSHQLNVVAVDSLWKWTALSHPR